MTEAMAVEVAIVKNWPIIMKIFWTWIIRRFFNSYCCRK